MLYRILDCLFRRVINLIENRKFLKWNKKDDKGKSRHNQIYHSNKKNVYKQITSNSEMNGRIYK